MRSKAPVSQALCSAQPYNKIKEFLGVGNVVFTMPRVNRENSNPTIGPLFFFSFLFSYYYLFIIKKKKRGPLEVNKVKELLDEGRRYPSEGALLNTFNV